MKQETLRVVTIATICSNLLHFANFNISKYIHKKLYRRYLLRVLNMPLLLKSLQTFYSFKVSNIINLEICYFFKLFYFFQFINHAIKHLIIKPFDLLNTILLIRTKALVNNLL